MKNKLKNLIKKSKLNPKQKEIWYTLLEIISEDEITAISELLEEDPGRLDFLTENLLSKIEGFSQKDQNILDEVLRKEKEYLEKLEEKRNKT